MILYFVIVILRSSFLENNPGKATCMLEGSVCSIRDCLHLLAGDVSLDDANFQLAPELYRVPLIPNDLYFVFGQLWSHHGLKPLWSILSLRLGRF